MFSTSLSTLSRTRLTATTDHDDNTFTVADASVLPSPGGVGDWQTVFRGRETFQYDQVVGNVLGGAGRIQRGVYGWRHGGLTETRLARRHTVSDGVAVRDLYVSDHPQHWIGKRATLMVVQLDASGYARGTGWTSDAVVEVRSGFIASQPVPSGDWCEIVIECNGLTYPLEEWDIGRKKSCGYLPSPAVPMRYIGSEGVLFRLAHTYGVADLSDVWYQVTDDGTSGGTAITGWVSVDYLMNRLALRAQNIINDDAGADVILIASQFMVSDISVDGPADDNRIQVGNISLFFAVGSAPADGTLRLSLFGPEWRPTLENYIQKVSDATIEVSTLSTQSHKDIVASFLALYSISLFTTIPPDATEIPVSSVSDESGIPVAPASSGYALISGSVNGANIEEIIKYTGVTASTSPASTYVLTGCTRALFNSMRGMHWTCGIDAAGAVHGAVKISFAWGWGDESTSYPGTRADTIALSALVSTGTTSYHGAAYDTLGAGLALDPAAIDHLAIVAGLSGERRRGLLTEGRTFAELMKGIALAAGVYFTAATDDYGRYRITARDGGAPPISAIQDTTVSFTDSDGTILTSPRPAWDVPAGKPYDIVSAKIQRWQTGSEPDETSILVVDGAREQDEMPGDTLDLPMWGVTGSTEDVRAAVVNAAARIFGLHDPHERLLSFATNATGLRVEVGDFIRVTIAGIPNPEGGTGLSFRPGRVVRVQSSPFRPGSQAASVITVAIKPAWVPGWSPSFYVSAKAGTPEVIDIDDNVFTVEGQPSPWGLRYCRDWHYGPQSGESMAVLLYEEGDYANRVSRTASHSSDGKWQLDSPSGLTVPFYGCFADYDSANATQKRSAYIADTTPTLGAGGDDPHEWTA